MKCEHLSFFREKELSKDFAAEKLQLQKSLEATQVTIKDKDREINKQKQQVIISIYLLRSGI